MSAEVSCELVGKGKSHKITMQVLHSGLSQSLRGVQMDQINPKERQMGRDAQRERFWVSNSLS